jgi:formiminotetrahydrofolate cyclodeaminase
VADLLVAAEFLGSSLLAAYHIAAANLPLLSPKAMREDWAGKLAQARQKGQETLLRVRTRLTAR